jgi:hypothetical protein
MMLTSTLKSRAAIAAGVCVTLLALPAPAQAADVSVTDPAGDAVSGGLDITNVTFGNRDHAFVVTVSFVRDTPGKVIASIKTRGSLPVGIAAKHYRHGPDKILLLGIAPCKGASSTWRRSAAMVELRVPARCLNHGNYGAIKSWALTEPLRNGADSDFAPESANGEDIRFTDWIPRG